MEDRVMQRSTFGLGLGLLLLLFGGTPDQAGDTSVTSKDQVTSKQVDDCCRVPIGGELLTGTYV